MLRAAHARFIQFGLRFIDLLNFIPAGFSVREMASFIFRWWMRGWVAGIGQVSSVETTSAKFADSSAYSSASASHGFSGAFTTSRTDVRKIPVADYEYSPAPGAVSAPEVEQ